MRPRELRTVAIGNAYRIDVEGGGHTWVLDEPVERGGSGAGPTPVESFLGALVSCLTVSFQFQARRAGIPIQRIEGWVAGTEERYLKEIAVELEVWSDARAADVEALLPKAERGCFVSDVLKPEIAYSVELAVYPATAAAGSGARV